MTVTDFRATERHFVDHLAPIWHAIDPDERGEFAVAQPVSAHARRLGLDVVHHQTGGRTTVVASFGDLKRARKLGPVIYLEHGAGQTYTGIPSGSYIGGDRAGVVGVLVPGSLAYDRHTANDGAIPARIVGCPKLDRLVDVKPHDPPVVGITFHWDCYLTSETRSAFRHHLSTVRRIAQRWPVLGHAHPRADGRMSRHCARYDIPYTTSLDEVFDTCAVLVADNTSALYEFAALDRPVVALNAPWYRRDVEHGLRFWSHVPGEQADTPDDAVHAVRRALEHDPYADRRRAIVAQVYGQPIGQATASAVAAIREWTA